MNDTREWAPSAQGKAPGFVSLRCDEVQPDTNTPFVVEKGIGAMASREVLANTVNVSIGTQRVLRAICPEERSPTRGGKLLFAGPEDSTKRRLPELRLMVYAPARVTTAKIVVFRRIVVFDLHFHCEMAMLRACAFGDADEF